MKQRILVVDDNVEAARSMHALLREMGHEVEYATSGQAAMACARKLRPTIVFADLGLPDMEGYRLCHDIRREPGLENVRVIVVTGHAGEEHRQQSLEAGCEHHLVKPLDWRSVESLLGPRAT